EYLRPARESGNLSAIDVEQKPRLRDLPETRAQLERLGVASELAEAMLDSWLSYSALHRRLYNDGEKRSKVVGEDIDSTLEGQGKQVAEQVAALARYVESYGVEETTELVDTFGIYNFIRYRPEQLHNQLLSWQSGEVPARNIVASAHADWNGSMADAGRSIERVLGEDGLFCFEVNDKVDIAKLAVAVGNRERAMGREPEKDGGIKNFVINAHASPTGMLLGTRGQYFEVSDYTEEPLNGQRANTYRRHLGSNFRVILKACSTAGEVTHGKNIAETISDYHDVRVEGSKVDTSGSIIIEPDGTVRFNRGEVPSTVYG
ncbi:MAG: hypothetical protein LC687_01905, partial [Actinobacteria bacterium]|nr:hypothetical protein [Actinomycetota bacterium]